jgi:hypothetical protein
MQLDPIANLITEENCQPQAPAALSTGNFYLYEQSRMILMWMNTRQFWQLSRERMLAVQKAVGQFTVLEYEHKKCLQVIPFPYKFCEL